MEVKTTYISNDDFAADAARTEQCWNNAVLRRLAGADVVDAWIGDMLAAWRTAGLVAPQLATVDDVFDAGGDAVALAYLPPVAVLFGQPSANRSATDVRRLADCTVGEATTVEVGRAMDFAAGALGGRDDPHVMVADGWPSPFAIRTLLRHLAAGVVAAASARRPLRDVVGLAEYHVRAESSTLVVSPPLVRAMPATADAAGFLSLAAYFAVRPEKIVLTRKK